MSFTQTLRTQSCKVVKCIHTFSPVAWTHYTYCTDCILYKLHQCDIGSLTNQHLCLAFYYKLQHGTIATACKQYHTTAIKTMHNVVYNAIKYFVLKNPSCFKIPTVLSDWPAHSWKKEAAFPPQHMMNNQGTVLSYISSNHEQLCKYVNVVGQTSKLVQNVGELLVEKHIVHYFFYYWGTYSKVQDWTQTVYYALWPCLFFLVLFIVWMSEVSYVEWLGSVPSEAVSPTITDTRP